MTNQELIAELQKLPPHYPAFFYDGKGWTCIDTAAVRAPMGDIGPIVEMAADPDEELYLVRP